MNHLKRLASQQRRPVLFAIVLFCIRLLILAYLVARPSFVSIGMILLLFPEVWVLPDLLESVGVPSGEAEQVMSSYMIAGLLSTTYLFVLLVCAFNKIVLRCCSKQLPE